VIEFKNSRLKHEIYLSQLLPEFSETFSMHIIYKLYQWKAFCYSDVTNLFSLQEFSVS